MHHFILILALLSLTLTINGAEKERTQSDAIYEKALVDSTKDAEKAYGLYLNALSKSTEKVLKSLESAKQDFNDINKFPKLTIQEKAKEIGNIEEKIKEVKEGAVAKHITAKDGRNLLVEKNHDLAKFLVGTWSRDLKNREYVFNEDGSFTQNGIPANNGKWMFSKNKVVMTAIEGSITTLTIKSNTEMTGTMTDGSAVTFTKK